MTEENKEDVALSSDWFCKLPAPRVDVENAWKDDIMDRQRFGQSLLNFLQRETQPLTVALHGQWGAGKTFFLERWRTDLEKEGVPVVYLNAWEDDFLDDPMTSLFGQAYAQIKDNSFTECYKTACEITPQLTKAAVFKAASYLSLGIVPGDAKDFRSVAENICQEYQNILAQKCSFQDNLAKYALVQRKATKSPLVFIVDELDRCRPSHAIQFLERIKHFFAVPNVAFVLGVDLVNLKKSIAAVYGEIDVDAYLRRFFDFEFLLENPSSRCYFEELVKRYDLENLLVHNVSLSSLVGFEVARYLFHSQRASLRQIEHFMRLIVFVLKSLEPTDQEVLEPYFYNILFILAAYRVLEPEAYAELKNAFIDTQPIDRLIKYIADNYNPTEERTAVFVFLYMLQYFSLEKDSQVAFLNDLNKYLPKPKDHTFPLSQIEAETFDPYAPLSRETKQEIARIFQEYNLGTSPFRFNFSKKLNFFCNLLDGIL